MLPDFLFQAKQYLLSYKIVIFASTSFIFVTYFRLRPFTSHKFSILRKKASINTRFKINLPYQSPSYTISQQIYITMPPLLLSCHQQFRYRKWTGGYKYFLQSMSRFRFQDYRFLNRLPLLQKKPLPVHK